MQIEETYNTREVEEIVEEFKEIYGDYLTGYFCCNGSECGCNGTEVDIEAYRWLRTTLHHQLQKAREEERERIMRWTSENYSRSTQPLYAHVDLLNLQNFIRQPDHSELDQGKKYTMGVDFAKRDHSELDQDVTGK